MVGCLGIYVNMNEICQYDFELAVLAKGQFKNPIYFFHLANIHP